MLESNKYNSLNCNTEFLPNDRKTSVRFGNLCERIGSFHFHCVCMRASVPHSRNPSKILQPNKLPIRRECLYLTSFYCSISFTFYVYFSIYFFFRLVLFYCAQIHTHKRTHQMSIKRDIRKQQRKKRKDDY